MRNARDQRRIVLDAVEKVLRGCAKQRGVRFCSGRHGETLFASLLQQYFGTGFAAQRLPGAWASTANFNEVVTFVGKDAVIVVVEDFRPGGSAGERHRFHEDADRLLRAAANAAGPGRLKSDTSLRPAQPPRALIPSTGEEKPSGESLIALMFLAEVAPGDIDPKRLSVCQRNADSGLYAQATAGYIQWLAPRLDQMRAEMNWARSRYREQAAHEGLHRRTPANDNLESSIIELVKRPVRRPRPGGELETGARRQLAFKLARGDHRALSLTPWIFANTR
jgi:hypothetical protein